ncbi:MAG: hypothetical protein ABJP87_11635, partial [Bauldia litoralis]|uniref:hypothetical protein n=1 Tax=Bauldia litoralis TaxID=665467 RepID=UPI003296C1D7
AFDILDAAGGKPFASLFERGDAAGALGRLFFRLLVGQESPVQRTPVTQIAWPVPTGIRERGKEDLILLAIYAPGNRA